MKRLLLGMMIPLVLMSVSCTEEPDDKPATQDTLVRSQGVYVLNEGVFNGNNASVTRFTFEDSLVSADIFMQQNGRGLGDTGSDLAIYGSKLYAVVNVSSQVEVMDASTGKSLKQIPLFNETVARQPRKIAFHGKHAFVCCFDGTVAVIDTTTLTVVTDIVAGPNPDGIAVAGGKVWVSNSGGLNFPDYNNTLSVIDPVSLTEERQVTAGVNPYVMAPDSYGDLYLIARGNYSDIPGRLMVLDAVSGEVKHTFETFEALNFSIAGDTAYVYNYNWFTGTSTILMINVKDETLITPSFITDGSEVKTVYGIAADPVSKLVYVADVMDFTGTGKIHVFNNRGERQFTFNAGINPAVFAFLNRTITVTP
jgi:hypothetical protein